MTFVLPLPIVGVAKLREGITLVNRAVRKGSPRLVGKPDEVFAIGAGGTAAADAAFVTVIVSPGSLPRSNRTTDWRNSSSA